MATKLHQKGAILLLASTYSAITYPFFHIVLSLPETSPYYHHECILLSQPYFLTTYMRWSVAGHLKQPGKKINKNFKKSAVCFKFSYKITTYYVGMSF